MRQLIENIGIGAVDLWMAARPVRRPAAAAIRDCKIVSHRGEHDNRSVRENTIRAFSIAKNAGVWGIEADIRWTADRVPVVHHDADTARVFGKTINIATTRFSDLRSAVPEIPTLAELVELCGDTTHLMLELKSEPFPDLERKKKILTDLLAAMRPVDDYHLLALEPELFEIFEIEPRPCCLPVARTNVAEFSKKAIRSGYGGLTGHYFLLNDRLIDEHRQFGQNIGTGFIASRNCLYREINRGVEWIFTNNAVKIQGIVSSLSAQTEDAAESV